MPPDNILLWYAEPFPDSLVKAPILCWDLLSPLPWLLLSRCVRSYILSQRNHVRNIPRVKVSCLGVLTADGEISSVSWWCICMWSLAFLRTTPSSHWSRVGICLLLHWEQLVRCDCIVFLTHAWIVPALFPVHPRCRIWSNSNALLTSDLSQRNSF